MAASLFDPNSAESSKHGYPLRKGSWDRHPLSRLSREFPSKSRNPGIPPELAREPRDAATSIRIEIDTRGASAQAARRRGPAPSLPVLRTAQNNRQARAT